jgi:hypothetical protein
MLFSFMSHASISAKHPSLVVDVIVNGHSLHSFSYRAPKDAVDGIRSIEIPYDLLAKSQGLLQIEFHMTTPVSPASLELSADSRTLGLGLVWVRLTPLPEH